MPLDTRPMLKNVVSETVLCCCRCANYAEHKFVDPGGTLDGAFCRACAHKAVTLEFMRGSDFTKIDRHEQMAAAQACATAFLEGKSWSFGQRDREAAAMRKEFHESVIRKLEITESSSS